MRVILDIDERATHYEGHAYLVDNSGQGLGGIFATVRTPTKSGKQTIALNVDELEVIHPVTLDRLSRAEVATQFPNQLFPTMAWVDIELINGELHVEFRTNQLTNGKGVLPASRAALPSDYKTDPAVHSWKKFKKYAAKQELERYIYRGQSAPSRLRTTFHRTKRKDLIRFVERDIVELNRFLTPRMTHLLNMRDQEHYAAFCHLLQHHGFPTPLLDWTYSPFVAAFFAFQNFARFDPDDENDVVRILQFDAKQWQADHPRISRIAWPNPHLSIVEPIFIGNDRAVPQQSVSTVTNLDDIEAYIDWQEKRLSKTYLKVIDLKRTEAIDAMRDLRRMGINAGSMFPGISGTCEDQRSRLFDLDD